MVANFVYGDATALRAVGAIDFTFARKKHEIVVLLPNKCITMYPLYKESQVRSSVT